MAEPTEDEVRMALMVLGNALGSEAQHLSIASAIATIETALDEARKDKARIDAMERGDVEVQPMGTTACYFNVVTPDGRLYTTAGGKLTLRAAIDQARGA